MLCTSVKMTDPVSHIPISDCISFYLSLLRDELHLCASFSHVENTLGQNSSYVSHLQTKASFSNMAMRDPLVGRELSIGEFAPIELVKL